jgi:hypothetical protein
MTTLRGCELRCIHHHSMAQPFGSAADAGRAASVSWPSAAGQGEVTSGAFASAAHSFSEPS